MKFTHLRWTAAFIPMKAPLRHADAALLIALFTLTIGASAQQSELWRIGQFDKSSQEFHDSHDVDYVHATEPLVYRIGQSHEKDWLRFQPGPANGLAGGRVHSSRRGSSRPVHIAHRDTLRNAAQVILAVGDQRP